MFELHKDENVLLYIRRHWLFLAFQTLGVLGLFLTPVVFVWIAQYYSFVPEVKLLGVSIYSLSNILIYLWALFCWMLLAEKFTDYAIDFWVVTNKRIIESELIKLFDVQLSTLELKDIEDITVRSGGFWANLIGFGKLEVQTAGAANEFYTDHIGRPAFVQKVMFDAKLADQQEERDIEKGEFEQIAQRVNREVTHKQDFDWAHKDEEKLERQEIEKETGFIEDKYKKDLGDALKSGE